MTSGDGLGWWAWRPGKRVQPRFQDGNHAAAYVALAPSTRQSGNHCYRGHITKRGSSLARGVLTQAQHASRHGGPLEPFFRRLMSVRLGAWPSRH